VPTQALLLILGLLLIIKGGDLFVSAAVRIAEFMRLPHVVIGSTLVSLATTMPELAVSVMAGAKGQSGLAVGNAVGSVMCNLGLILGVTATIKHVDVHPRVLKSPLLVMLACAVILVLMTFNLVLARWQGMLLFVAGSGYFAWEFIQSARDRKPADVAEAIAIERAVAHRFTWFHSRAGTVVQFMLGAGTVILGSRLLVDSAVSVAGALGIPPIIIGLTVVALGTSLPELVTAITSSRKSVSDLAVGNVLGANIANLTLIVGMAAILQEVHLDPFTRSFNFPAMLVMMCVLLWMMLNDRRVTRREGVVLLVGYAIYLAAIVVFAAGGKS
jgi:cation:H+ antiporter